MTGHRIDRTAAHACERCGSPEITDWAFRNFGLCLSCDPFARPDGLADRLRHERETAAAARAADIASWEVPSGDIEEMWASIGRRVPGS